MSEKIIVPTLGESVTEATVSKWLKNQGEKVNSDEPLVELETDKVNIEVPAPSSGVLSQINVKEGQTVNVGTLLGEVSTAVNSNKIKVKDEKGVINIGNNFIVRGAPLRPTSTVARAGSSRSARN